MNEVDKAVFYLVAGIVVPSLIIITVNIVALTKYFCH